MPIRGLPVPRRLATLAEIATHIEEAGHRASKVFARVPAILTDMPQRARGVVVRIGGNDDAHGNPTPPEFLTVFHSIVLPRLSLRATVEFFHDQSVFDVASIAVALTLMKRFERRTGLQITALMMHRLLTTALLVAAKAYQDNAPKNAAVAAIAGIQIRDINRMEATLLKGLGWQVHVSHEEFVELVTSTSVGEAEGDAASPAQREHHHATGSSDTLAAKLASSAPRPTLSDLIEQFGTSSSGPSATDGGVDSLAAPTAGHSATPAVDGSVGGSAASGPVALSLPHFDSSM